MFAFHPAMSPMSLYVTEKLAYMGSRWGYYADEADTTDAGSYCPSDVELEERSHQRMLLSSMPADAGSKLQTSGLGGSNLSTRPPQGPRMAVPGTEPMKVQLPAEARSLPTLLDPRLPAKKKPTFAKEFGPGPSSLNPQLPAKKRVPENLVEAGARVVQEYSAPPAAR
eukprot:gb/GFBE01013668.1/.p1 GENE.gb/GFBE01013668.1/~~gb/GFBE01013668.1/.p1  ORF type:complete len:168 (+),score=16.29 gb/GFBE01013668.1/:1-504(+)